MYVLMEFYVFYKNKKFTKIQFTKPVSIDPYLISHHQFFFFETYQSAFFFNINYAFLILATFVLKPCSSKFLQCIIFPTPFLHILCSYYIYFKSYVQLNFRSLLFIFRSLYVSTGIHYLNFILVSSCSHMYVCIYIFK